MKIKLLLSTLFLLPSLFASSVGLAQYETDTDLTHVTTTYLCELKTGLLERHVIVETSDISEVITSEMFTTKVKLKSGVYAKCSDLKAVLKQSNIKEKKVYILDTFSINTSSGEFFNTIYCRNNYQFQITESEGGTISSFQLFNNVNNQSLPISCNSKN